MSNPQSFPASVYATRLTRAQQLATSAGTPLVITPGPTSRT